MSVRHSDFAARCLAIVLPGIAACVVSGASARADNAALVPEQGLGNVHMDTSCDAAVRDEFDRGLALLYSFWYDRSLTMFDRVIKDDPNCAIAYWGAAMTFNHPLWAPPSDTDMKAALTYLDRAKNASESNDLERGYLAAVRDLYGDANSATKDKRDEKYLNDMATLHASHADDNTALFYVLAIDGTMYGADPAKITTAAGLLQSVLAHQPQHPGALHYSIHTFDFDGYAGRGLAAARAYAASAPAIPHALHMPSHIYLRLGLWQDAVDSNIAAWAASEDAVKRAGETGNDREFHDLHFEEYARLQLGQYKEAKREVIIALDQFDQNMRLLKPAMSEDDKNNLIDLSYDATGMAASYMMESGDYSLVDRLPSEVSFPALGFVQSEVRAYAAMKRKDAGGMLQAATVATHMLDPASIAKLRPGGQRFAKICGYEIKAALAQAHGDQGSALANAALAAQVEDTAPVFTQPTMPPIPAHELYGRMLADYGQNALAYAELHKSLARAPNRTLGLRALAQVAQALGKTDEAGKLRAQVTALWAQADQPGS